ncbi:ABC transporter ATP-binding protein [Kozakia baliensis]|uniref:ABC transporter ATP-binding protein n=1 Tax=Kozakia baliensis TaxID=153496 RepID=UPI00345C3A96
MSASQRRPIPRLSLREIKLTNHSSALRLDVASGERLVFFGDAPAELSRLCDVIAGFVAPASGEILLDGRDITSLSPVQRPIGLLSDRDPLFEHLTVRGNIAFPLQARKETAANLAARTNRVLALLGLDAAAEKRVAELTPEQAFRTRLGRLIAYAPSVILLDDPLIGLDAAATRRSDALLATLARALELTIIYATPRRDEALRVGSRIAVFSGAELLQCADAMTLLDRPEDERVAVLFGEANALPGRVLKLDDDVARIRLAAGGVVEAMADPELKEDTLCDVCIRPDRIAPLFGMSLAGEEDDPPLMATLQDLTHLGDHVRMRLRLEDGTEIELRRPPMQNLRGVVPGVKVQLAWQAGQAVAFPLRDAL